MRILTLLILWLCLSQQLLAQGGVWTWMKGDSVVVNTISLGNYGTMGVTAASNEAPGRYHCTYWQDTSGNFWITGGQIFNVGPLNDLWKYEPATNMWTWMNGAQITSNINGVFGTQGIPSTNNYPPAYGLTGIGWTDTNNNLWLQHQRGDLWRYSIATNEWTWMKGTGGFAQPAVYGIQGVPNMLNTPGGNTESKACWTDSLNNLWLYDDGNVWKYDIASNMWTWIKGGGAGPVTANYGVLGIPAMSNQPAQGASFNYWQDKQDRFYIGFSAFTISAFWRYDPATNMWTWLGGTAGVGINHGRNYISQCVASSDRYPGIRIEGRGANYNTQCEEEMFWFCAGQDNGYYNDLWVYKPSNNTWTWVAGDSISGVYGNYGVQGVPASTNKMADRTGHAMWVDKYQQTWVFGGIARGSTSRGNDMWRFTPDMNCLGILIDTFQLYPPADTMLCYGESTQMYADSNFNISVSPGGGVNYNADSTIITFNPITTTTYTVDAFVNALCPNPRQITFTIVVIDEPMPLFTDDTLCVGESAMIALDSTYTYQFQPFANVQYQPGDDEAIIQNAVSTTYTVTAIKNGCIVRDTAYFTIHILPDPIAAFTISPPFAPIDNAVFVLSNQSQNAVSYAWYQGSTFLDNTIHYTYTASDTGKICFQLFAYNALQCVDSIEHCAEVLPTSAIFIPNAFSPNGDGVNDVFKLVAKNISLLSFKIFDRWGEEIFSTDDIRFGWNGKYKGKDSELGVYFYLVEYSDILGKHFLKKGDISLVR
ncbi:MAG: gliding motility-associated C-terminal domain-containing protein [Bacteroidetes bacterium]|nr:gliding motility-associated C-terminal domain-containing protein [Bacteroidota bacterium]